MAKKKRFVISYTQGTISAAMVLVDTETGVNYLFCRDGYGGGLTPLLNRDGTPVITSVIEEP